MCTFLLKIWNMLHFSVRANAPPGGAVERILVSGADGVELIRASGVHVKLKKVSLGDRKRNRRSGGAR